MNFSDTNSYFLEIDVLFEYCTSLLDIIVETFKYFAVLAYDDLMKLIVYITPPSTQFNIWMVSLTGIVVLATLVLGIILSPSLKLKKLRQYRKCHHDLTQIIIKNDCNPILLRLAWSDAASYDHSIRHWPDCGGVNGSIHYDYELAHPSNAGLSKAIEILKPLKKKYHYVSWADLIQMGGVLAVELAGGPRLSDKMLYGRIDAPRRQFRTQTTSKQNLTQLAPNQDKLMKKNMSTDKLSALNSSNGHTNQLNIKLGSPGYEMNNELEASRLPVALPPYPDGAINAEVHIRNHFYRMGLNHRETVVLIGGGHTLGRAFANRSGVCKNVTGDIGATSYTKPTSIAKSNGLPGIGMPGGCSWTVNWLTFDNNYFKRIKERRKANKKISDQDSDNQSSESGNATSSIPFNNNHQEIRQDELLWLPTDQALYDAPEFKQFFLMYARHKEVFFVDYAQAHIKFTNLGAKFDPPEGIQL